MKRQFILLTALLAALIFQPARAQTYKHKLANKVGNAIELSVPQNNVEIEGYDGNEVMIQNLNYTAPPSRAKGLKPLYGAAEDNTGIGLYTNEENGTLKITPASRKGSYRLKIPNKIRVKINEISWGSAPNIVIKNHKGEIEVNSKSGNIELGDITGPAVVNNTAGNIDVVFSNLSNTTPSSFSVLNGHIDITLPESTKTNIKMSSMTGEIYTNLDIKMKGDKAAMRRLGGGRTIEGTLNGGGVQLSLKTISGDIYLRKSH